MTVKHLKNCLACRSKNLVLYIDLGNQPLANSYSPEPLTGDLIKSYPLQVNLCLDCSHSQLSVIVDPEEMFTDYKYVSGTTYTLKNHFADLVQEAVSRSFNRSGVPLRVLDIGANDGTLMEEFKKKGCIVKGIDPAESMQEHALKKGLDIIKGFWSGDTAFSFPEEFDIITACNVFAHNLDPFDFLKGCGRVLNLGGYVIIEFPYGKNTIKERQFDQFYHEHINYFTVKSFATLTEKARFRIVKITESPVHGGSIRFYLQKSILPHVKEVREYIKQEALSGVHSKVIYEQFLDDVMDNMRNLNSILDDHFKNGDKIVAYGASAKSTVLFNYNRSLAKYIYYVVDDNPAKQGLFCPRSNLPIVAPQELVKEEGDLVILLTSWNFTEEIKKKIKDLRPGKTDTLITYVPKTTKI